MESCQKPSGIVFLRVDGERPQWYNTPVHQQTLMTDGLGCVRSFDAGRSGAPHGVRAYPHFLPTVWAHFPVTAGECALFSMHTHRKKKKCAISSPCGATGNDAQKLHAYAFAHFRSAVLMHEVLYEFLIKRLKAFY